MLVCTRALFRDVEKDVLMIGVVFVSLPLAKGGNFLSMYARFAVQI